MKKYQLAKNFWLWEFLPKRSFNKWGEAGQWFIDDSLPEIMQDLRDVFGALHVNTWKEGGRRAASGWRPPWMKGYSLYSQHRFGKAVDFYSDKYDSQEIRDYIKKNFYELGITAIEDFEGMTWVHLDVRFTLDPTKLMVFGK